MKLPIKKKYFEMMLKGNLNLEHRDAHITYVCEETGREILAMVKKVSLIDRENAPQDLFKSGILSDDKIIEFAIEPVKTSRKIQPVMVEE